MAISIWASARRGDQPCCFPGDSSCTRVELLPVDHAHEIFHVPLCDIGAVVSNIHIRATRVVRNQFIPDPRCWSKVTKKLYRLLLLLLVRLLIHGLNRERGELLAKQVGGQSKRASLTSSIQYSIMSIVSNKYFLGREWAFNSEAGGKSMMSPPTRSIELLVLITA